MREATEGDGTRRGRHGAPVGGRPAPSHVRWFGVAALVLFGICGPAAAAQDPGRDSTGSVAGVVVSGITGEPLFFAAVGVVGTTRGMMTDSAGRFVVDRLPAGRIQIRVSLIGYAPATRPVDVVAGRTTELTVSLTVMAATVDPVLTVAVPDARERFDAGASTGVITLGRGISNRVPSIGEADLLRTVQLLPGVLARSDFTAGYNVRGGESDQNLVLLDGIPVYNPFHFGGLFGTFVDPTVESIELHLGGYPASYGGRLSSVLDVHSAEEQRPGVHGTAGVSLLASTLALGGALPERGTSWSVAGRRTYADLLARLFSDAVLPYHFQDAQFHVAQRLPRDASLSVTAYTGVDDLGGNFAALGDASAAHGGDFGFAWGNAVMGTTLTVPLGEPRDDRGTIRRAELVQRASISRFHTDLDLGDGSLTFANRVSEVRLGGSVTLPRAAHTPSVGYEVSWHRVAYDVRSAEADIELFELRQRPAAISLYAEDEWRPASSIRLRGGARAERIAGRGWVGVSPRLSATWFLDPDFSLTLGAGRFTQWLHGLRNEDIPVRIFDFWVASDAAIDVSVAHHLTLGAERWLPAQRVVRVEGFVKRYERLLEPNPADDPEIRGDEFIPADGLSYGVDVLLRQLERGPLSGWLAYSYAVSTRERDGVRYAPAQDRRHNVNAVASWALSDRMTLGARFGFGTGLPYTDIVGQIVRRTYDPATNTWTVYNGFQAHEPVGGARNTSRYPSFQRLDLMLSRRFTRGRTTWTPYLQVVNAYNRRNVFIYTFDYTANPPEREATSQFPFLPSLGLTVEF